MAFSQAFALIVSEGISRQSISKTYLIAAVPNVAARLYHHPRKGRNDYGA
jgi:hypothetical protein